MSKYELVAFVVGITTSAGTIVALANIILRRPRGDTTLSASTEARLARIESAVDSIAVEVERISEAQRFSARLLAEGQRPGDALASSAYQEGRIRG